MRFIVPSSKLCHAERFFVRWKHATRNHVFCALRAFMHLEVKRSAGLIASWYDFKRHFADQAITNFIRWLRECAQQGAEGLVTKCSLFFR